MASKRGRPPHPELLTPTEAKVLTLVREGLHNPEIATRMGVSVNTVRFHVSNLLAKSGLSDHVALRTWNPEPAKARPWYLPASGLPFLKPFGIVAGSSVAVAVAVAVIIAASSRGEESTAPIDGIATAFSGAVVGTLTRQSGGLVVTEPGGSSFRLTSELTFARLVGSQVFIVGNVEGDTIRPAGGSRIGPDSRCTGVLAESGGTVSVGGTCRGMQLSGVPIERLLALSSEKVTVTILACTQSHDGRIENPPIDAFGDERVHTCAGSPAGGSLGQQ